MLYGSLCHMTSWLSSLLAREETDELERNLCTFRFVHLSTQIPDRVIHRCKATTSSSWEKKKIEIRRLMISQYVSQRRWMIQSKSNSGKAPPIRYMKWREHPWPQGPLPVKGGPCCEIQREKGDNNEKLDVRQGPILPRHGGTKLRKQICEHVGKPFAPIAEQK